MKNVRNASLLLAAFLPLTLNAQQATVKGWVQSDMTHTALAQVTVTVDGGNTHTVTNKKGEYEITKLITGTHTLAFTLTGFEAAEITVQINTENETVTAPEVKLKPSAIQIPEVMVYQQPVNYSTRYQGSNTTVSAKEIDAAKPLGTEEILKKLPGITVAGDMGISNRLNVGIRGSYPRRSANLLLMEDGSPIAPAPYLAPEAYYNPPSERMDGIEVMKGADILAYGSNTMYGAINYITKKPPVTPTLGLNFIAGENGYHSQYITYGGTWNKTGAELQVLNKYFGGFQQNSQSAIFNTTAKIYSDLNKRSNFYVKLNYHQEKSLASYSALTPFTFTTDATQNPFDADELLSKRYAVDLIYNYKLTNNLVLSSKVYANQFQRDWWRQENTLIKASAAKTYLGDEIYNDRYSYLDGKTFGADDWIRVGKIANGTESARARNRMFRVGGLQESIKHLYQKENFTLNSELVVKGHWESFANVEIKNDSSRFARSGTMDKDQYFQLSAWSFYLKEKITFKRFSVTPAVRYEILKLYGWDRLAIAKMTDNDGTRLFGAQKNAFNNITPGASAAFELVNKGLDMVTVYAGIYKGYTAPIADHAFLHVQDDVVSAATTTKPSNKLAETSLNYEAGIRGMMWKEITSFQLTYFNNNINNYYSAGRNEAFQTLGAVNINGVEANINLNLHHLLNLVNHELVVSVSGSYMAGKVLSGKLQDSDLLKAKHTDATKNELIDKINAERSGYDVYFTGSGGQDSLVTGALAYTDFSSIKKLDLNFGNDGIANNTVPYLPPYVLNAGLYYTVGGFSVGANLNYVAKQYTDYLNFENETAEGAIGVLPAFKTIDANIGWSFEKSKNKYIKGLSLFVAAKNITNEVYRASRLHRVSSGIMPYGFRQINAGLKYNF